MLMNCTSKEQDEMKILKMYCSDSI